MDGLPLARKRCGDCIRASNLGWDRSKEKLPAVDGDRAQGVAGIREYTNGLISNDVQREEKKQELEEKSAGLKTRHYR
jgi:hypothetical protein